MLSTHLSTSTSLGSPRSVLPSPTHSGSLNAVDQPGLFLLQLVHAGSSMHCCCCCAVVDDGVDGVVDDLVDDVVDNLVDDLVDDVVDDFV